MSGVFSAEFLTAMFSAFGGGVILNVMPCVFPLLAVKTLSLVRQSKESSDSKLLKKAGLAYLAGILCTLWALFGILILLRQAGQNLGWGFQFQSPIFTGAMALLFFGMAASLGGWLDISVPSFLLPQGLTSKDGLWGEFFAGLLSVLVASPCTAPLMAPAIGYALSQPAPHALAIAGALGLGYGIPFVLLCYFPKALKWLPRPGAWMNTFKEALSFPLLGAGLWLLWVFGRQTDSEMLVLLLSTLLFVVFLYWLSRKIRIAKQFVTLALLGIGAASLVFTAKAINSWKRPVGEQAGNASTSGSHGLVWQPFSPDLVEALRSRQSLIFVDFTADWCLSCKVNEKVVFGSEEVREEIKKRNISLVKADWTNEDPVITTALEKFGRSGVPLYLVYLPGEKEPKILPQILSPEIFLNAFRN